MSTSYTRRLPIYLLLDVSESMAGTAIEAVEKGVKTLVETLRGDPMALETAHLSVITFARKAEQVTPLTELMQFQPPKLSVRAGSSLGAGIRLLLKCLKGDVRRTTATQKGDYKPLVFLLTDGQPTDNWEAAVAELKRASNPKIANIYAIGCGVDVDPGVLREVSDIVLMMNDLSPDGFKKFFIWLSASVQSASLKLGDDLDMPRLPEGMAVPADDDDEYDADNPRQLFLQALCQKQKKPYLMRFARRERDEAYEAISSHKLDVFEKDAGDHMPPVNTSRLDGLSPCPYCENEGGGYCECGTLFCYNPIAGGTVTCPGCRQPWVAGGPSYFDLRRTSGWVSQRDVFVPRRMPIYLVLDCSAATAGEPIEAVRMGIKALLAELRCDPNGLELVALSIIAYGGEARVLVPLVELMQFNEPVFNASGAPCFGAAIRLLEESIEREVRPSTATKRGDWKPVVLIFVLNQPSDGWEAPAKEFRRRRLGHVTGLLGGTLEVPNLELFFETTVRLDSIQPDSFSYLFPWRSSGDFEPDFDKDALGIDNRRTRWMNDDKTTDMQQVPQQHTSGGGSMAEFTGRRLPVYLVLDCSGSMSGEPIEATRQGIKALLAELRGDPQALETAFLSVITFDSSARQVCPLTELMLFQEPTLDATGSTCLGEALTLLEQAVDKEVRKSTATQKGDWKPLIFLMTDGQPTDSWQKPAESIKKRRLGNLIACGAGPGADLNPLKTMTETVVKLDNLQPDTLKQFFKWVSDSVKMTSASVAQVTADSGPNLPPPPQGVQLVP